MRYASIDVETTGLDVKRCEMIEIAVVVEDTAAVPLPPVVDLPHVVLRAWPDTRACWEQGAFEMHQKSGLLRDLDESGMSRERLFDTLRTFLIEEFGSGKIVVAGKNFNGFDKYFLSPPSPLSPTLITERLHHRVLDPGSMFVDWTQDAPLSLDALLRRFMLAESVSHRALDDARDVVRVLRQSYVHGRTVAKRP